MQKLQIVNCVSSLIFRYMVTELNGGSLLRIEPVRKKQEDTEFECVAENGVGDPVSVKAHLHVYDGKTYLFVFLISELIAGVFLYNICANHFQNVMFYPKFRN